MATFKIITSIDGLTALEDRWKVSSKDPFTEFDFYSLILTVRSPKSLPCIIYSVGADVSDLVAVARLDDTSFDIKIGYFTLLSVPTRRITVLAGGLQFANDRERLVKNIKIIDQVISHTKADLVIFEQIEASSLVQEVLTSCFSGWYRTIINAEAKHWFLDLPVSVTELLKAKKKKQRYWLNRLPRVLDSDFNGRWEIRSFKSPDDVDEFICLADRIASKSYQRRLNAGFIDNVEYRRRVYFDAVNGRLCGYILCIEDKPAAFWYCFTFMDTLHLVATGYDSDFGKYEVGTVLLLRVFEEHCGSFVKKVDFGLGDADYKQKFGSHFITESDIFVFSLSIKGVLLRISYSFAQVLRSVLIDILNKVGSTTAVKTFWRRRLRT